MRSIVGFQQLLLSITAVVILYGLPLNATPCTQCTSKYDLAHSKKTSKAIEDAAKKKKNGPYALILKFFSEPAHEWSKKWSKACYNFIDERGHYGPWGKMLYNAIARHPTFYTSSSAITSHCHGFKWFSEKKKTEFFMLFLSAISQEESACHPNETSSPYENPNGRSVGLMAMDSNQKILYNRDKAYGERACTSGSMLQPEPNIKCAVAILAYQIETDNELLSQGSYWSNVRNPKRLPTQMISHFPGCTKHL